MSIFHGSQGKTEKIPRYVTMDYHLTVSKNIYTNCLPGMQSFCLLHSMNIAFIKNNIIWILLKILSIC